MVPALGTFIRIELELPESEFLRISSRAFARISELEKKLSFFDPQSEISLLNNSVPETWLSVSPETIELLSLASQIKKDSDGAFSAGNQLKFNESSVQKMSEEQIDLGGIAKGYIVDQAWKEILKAAVEVGITEVYGSVNAGGDLRLFEKLEVSIPIECGTGRILFHSMKSGALATSSVLTRTNSAASYSGSCKALRETVSVEADSAWLADALTKVALFHPKPEACLAKWKARLVYEA
jgi:thiamine biosynthesis lipoprotein